MTPWALWQQALSPLLPTPTEAAVDARATCSCGAHTRLNGTDTTTALAYLEAWHRDHKHEFLEDPPSPERREGMALSQAEIAEPIGFSGGDCV